jgi:hypothetical protein
LDDESRRQQSAAASHRASRGDDPALGPGDAKRVSVKTWALAGLLLAGGSNAAVPLAISLRDARHLTFTDIPPTQYRIGTNEVTATVSRSASYLLIPFATPLSVQSVQFDWQIEGRVAIRDAEHEGSKGGDDAAIRVGLLVSGPSPMIPFLAPVWLKALSGQLTHSAERLIFLVPDARHGPGSQWQSPYSSDIQSAGLASVLRTDGWRTASISFSEPLALVGVWIMADGDDTQSTFMSRLRNLVLNS